MGHGASVRRHQYHNNVIVPRRMGLVLAERRRRDDDDGGGGDHVGPPPRGRHVRHYRASAKKEILPLIAAGLVAAGGYYSYRAVQRVRADQEDYHYELQRYEREQVFRSETAAAASRAKTIAVDFGTCFTKLAATHPTLQVVVSREGDRCTFNGVAYRDNVNSNDNDEVGAPIAAGRAAQDRFYYHTIDDSEGSSDASGTTNGAVLLPYTLLTADAAGVSSTRTVTAQQMIADTLQPRLAEVLDRMELQQSSAGDPPVRSVVTLPSAFVPHPDVYERAFSFLSHAAPTPQLCLLPEPVAAVWGAQFHGIFPPGKTTRGGAPASSYLVIDIGGWTTQIAVVESDVVQQSTTLPWGGESVIEQLVNLLRLGAEQPLRDARSLALLQVQARQAVAELATQTRVAVHVPYVFADPTRHHLETTVARAVLDQAVNAYVREQLGRDVAADALSPHFPTPTHLTALWTSAITQVLERAGKVPAGIDAVLVVGGGARVVLSQQSLQSAWNLLSGDDATKLKRPDPSIQSELVVVGAATIPPSFDYSVTDGLIRR